MPETRKRWKPYFQMSLKSYYFIIYLFIFAVLGFETEPSTCQTFYSEMYPQPKKLLLIHTIYAYSYETQLSHYKKLYQLNFKLFWGSLIFTSLVLFQILIPTLQFSYFHCHFTGEKTEACKYVQKQSLFYLNPRQLSPIYHANTPIVNHTKMRIITHIFGVSKNIQNLLL